MDKDLYLVLEDGRRFKGKSFGAEGETIGEVCFTTTMTGYVETLTDPSWYGQLIVQTFPQIGNYGTMEEDAESRGSFCKGYIVHEWCKNPSNFRMQGDIDAFLKKKGVIGLYGIDTRSLTKAIRESGVMNGIITASPDAVDFKKLKEYRIEGAIDGVSTTESYKYAAKGDAKYKIALLDFGIKENIKRSLALRGAELTVFPGNTKPQTIISGGFDGIMLSNGPGDPTENTQIIANLKVLADSGVPIFGICMGHQLLALAMGAKTAKLKYGHRGANQPVRSLETGRVYITSQNHGYEVVSSSLPKNAKVLFENVNDGTCEGIEYTDRPIFTVQFHPEACGGPQTTTFLFDDFIQMIERCKNAVK